MHHCDYSRRFSGQLLILPFSFSLLFALVLSLTSLFPIGYPVPPGAPGYPPGYPPMGMHPGVPPMHPGMPPGASYPMPPSAQVIAQAPPIAKPPSMAPVAAPVISLNEKLQRANLLEKVNLFYFLFLDLFVNYLSLHVPISMPVLHFFQSTPQAK